MEEQLHLITISQWGLRRKYLGGLGWDWLDEVGIFGLVLETLKSPFANA